MKRIVSLIVICACLISCLTTVHAVNQESSDILNNPNMTYNELWSVVGIHILN